MNKKIEEFTINYENYVLKVLNIGATITEYSIDGHNVCLAYENVEDYRMNELYMGSVVGRTAGRIKNGKVGNWELPKNYNKNHNHHGNDLHLNFYEVVVADNRIECTLYDPEGDYPGDANIKVVYTLSDAGLTQEIFASSNDLTLFNFTNHTYFNLEVGTTVLNHELQIEASKYGRLDHELFFEKLDDVSGTAFDFRCMKPIGCAFGGDDEGQFARTKFIDHPFKLNGRIIYKNKKYKLEVKTTSDFAVIYTANYLSDSNAALKEGKCVDYGAICIETQKRPGDLNLTDGFYSRTCYKLTSI